MKNGKNNSIKLWGSFMLVALMSLLVISCGDDDSSDPNPPGGGNNTAFSLVIETGPITTVQGSSVPLSAVKVDANGNVMPASGVSWSIEDQSVATISGNTLEASGTGATFITAKLTENNTEFVTTIPIAVIGINTLFQVVPGAIIYEVSPDQIQLEPVYLGTGSPTYTYSSANSGIASVSNSGLVSFTGAGSTTLTVTCNDGSQNFTQSIPVLVLGEGGGNVSPVSRVVVSPASKNLFLDQTVQLNAKAYNSAGQEVGDLPVVWESKNDTVAGVNQNGLVTPNAFGRATVQAKVGGIIGSSEIFVYPNKVIIIEPFTVKKAKGESVTFTAETYTVNSQTFLLENNPDPSNPAGLKWILPFEGVPFFPSTAEITSSNTNSATVKVLDNNSIIAFPIPVEAYVEDPTIAPGGAVIELSQGVPCNCGTTDPSVASISVSPLNISLSFFSGETAQIEATAFDAFGDEVTGISFEFCTADILVANAGFDGFVSASGIGTTTIKVCHGSFSQDVTVTVQ